MTVWNKMLADITNLSDNKNPLLVAIDGRGGSGKTTIAEKIQQTLPVVSILSLDDFYIPSNNRVTENALPIDTDKLLKEILIPLTNKQEAFYSSFSAPSSRKRILPSGILLIEGWFALHHSLRSYYGYTIWIEADREVCLARGLARSLSGRSVSSGLTRAALQKRWEKYQQLEDKFIFEENPQLYASSIL